MQKYNPPLHIIAAVWMSCGLGIYGIKAWYFPERVNSRNGVSYMVKRAIRILALVAVLASAALGGELPSKTDGAAVVLRFEGTSTLTDEEQQRLIAAAQKILASSQFNSQNPQWEWDMSKVLTEYGDAVVGRHLLVYFAQPKQSDTAGGTIIAREVLIGLNRPDYASSLHTIDSNGHIVGHAKYSGALCIELKKLVDAIVSEPDKTMEPTQ